MWLEQMGAPVDPKMGQVVIEKHQKQVPTTPVKRSRREEIEHGHTGDA
jgi:hypothetical protein